MEMNRISIGKFHGYPSEDGERFLLDFGAYCAVHNIKRTDARKVAAFRLHLDGPAKVWFTLVDHSDDWVTVEAAFRDKYVQVTGSAHILEAEKFVSLICLPGQPLEQYYSDVIESGRKLRKSDTEIMLKFIGGLPDQLSFFVRAGHPTTVEQAFQAAGMGVAYGYSRPDGRTAVNATRHREDRLTNLEERFESLMKTDARSQHQEMRHCFQCDGKGHTKAKCNWGKQFEPQPTIECQVCSQFGHTARDCIDMMGRARGRYSKTNRDRDSRDAGQPTRPSGNGYRQRNAGRNPLGGQ